MSNCYGSAHGDQSESRNIWAVSPPLRLLLENIGHLRHAECCLLNRRIYTVWELQDMGTKDIQDLVNEVTHIWTELRWNTSRLSEAIHKLIQEAKRMCTQTPNEAAPEMSVSPVRPCNEHLWIFPPYLSPMSTAVPGPCDAAACLLQRPHATESMIELMKALVLSKELLCEDRYANIMLQVQLSEKRSAESAAALAKALEIADEVPLPADDPSIPEEQRPRRILKNAKRALRNVFLWVCIGWAKGLDSLEALLYMFPQYQEQLKAQLVNGFHKIRHAVAKRLTGMDALALPGSKQKRPKRENHSDTTTDVHNGPMKVFLHGFSLTTHWLNDNDASPTDLWSEGEDVRFHHRGGPDSSVLP